MKKETRLVVFTITIAVIAISLTILRYEKLLKLQNSIGVIPKVKGGIIVKELTAQEIIEQIKASKEYIGDSITLFENGRMATSNPKFQGTISAVINSEENMNIVKSNNDNNGLSIHYNIYVLAATYYRNQYTEEFNQK